MSNFKVGDVVSRIPGAGDYCRFEQAVGIKDFYTITDRTTHGTWVAVDGWAANGDRFPWAAGNFKLYTEQDDPLPPAPESVRYATLQYSWQGQYNDQALTVGPDTFTGSIALRIQGNSNSTRNKDMSLSVILDADDVLRLAHDLRRMAMEIKRKEKQDA